MSYFHFQSKLWFVFLFWMSSNSERNGISITVENSIIYVNVQINIDLNFNL